MIGPLFAPVFAVSQPRRFAPPDPAADLTDRLIRAEIPPNSRVLDLGCGDGRLLAGLRDDAGCRVTGVELDEAAFLAALKRRVPALRLDLDAGLPDLPTGGFDVAVLSQTLQQVRRPHAVLDEMLRLAPRAVVVVPNFGHWRVRSQLLFGGRAPVTNALPHAWYDTPNLHVMTLPRLPRPRREPGGAGREGGPHPRRSDRRRALRQNARPEPPGRQRAVRAGARPGRGRPAVSPAAAKNAPRPARSR